jgi:hypothetical protein
MKNQIVCRHGSGPRRASGASPGKRKVCLGRGMELVRIYRGGGGGLWVGGEGGKGLEGMYSFKRCCVDAVSSLWYICLTL